MGRKTHITRFFSRNPHHIASIGLCLWFSGFLGQVSICFRCDRYNDSVINWNGINHHQSSTKITYLMLRARPPHSLRPLLSRCHAPEEYISSAGRGKRCYIGLSTLTAFADVSWNWGRNRLCWRRLCEWIVGHSYDVDIFHSSHMQFLSVMFALNFV